MLPLDSPHPQAPHASLLPQFYARDEYDEAEAVQVHPLDALVLARFLRLQFRTDVLSFGNDTKCLRLEILGCPVGMWRRAEVFPVIAATSVSTVTFDIIYSAERSFIY